MIVQKQLFRKQRGQQKQRQQPKQLLREASSQSQDETEVSSKGDHESSNKDLALGSSSLSSGNNVWYRYVVMPFIRENKPLTYRQAFQRRVLRQVGIGVVPLDGLHESFRRSHVRFSPLMGMIYAHNNIINNLYRYGGGGDADQQEEPAVQLIQLLFHMLPGGEIQPTHVTRNAGAHLSSGLIGLILEIWESVQSKLCDDDADDNADDADETISRAQMVERFKETLSNHFDYQQSRQGAVDDLAAATLALEKLEQREKDSVAVREKIKEIEGGVIKVQRHVLKKLKSELNQATKNKSSSSSSSEIEQLHQQMAESEEITAKAKDQVEALRAHIVTSWDKKQARKALKRAQDALELEKQSLDTLSEVLTTCLWTYDRRVDSPFAAPCRRGQLQLPRYMTNAILQAYLWRKYDSLDALKPYLVSMDRVGALTQPVDSVLATVDRLVLHKETALDLKQSRLATPLLPWAEWSPQTVAKAVTLVIGKPGNVDRPPIIPFSYVSWAAYSKFADCGETAIRNLMNQMVYNCHTSQFDYSLLEELRQQYYPRLNSKLINFYRRHPRPQDVTDPEVALEWIGVVSRLNRARENKSREAPAIRYRREAAEQNIASPLSNLLRVINALFGIEPLDDMESIKQVAVRINELRKNNNNNTTAKNVISIDMTGIKRDGFGCLSLSVGDVRYELQSYKPVHFSFLQVETSQSAAAGRYEFDAFSKLMNYSANSRPRGGGAAAKDDDDWYFEQLALASIFVPYQLARDELGSFFATAAPAHYALLFADLDGTGSKQSALKWARAHQHESTELSAFLERIQNYVEPTFGPVKATTDEPTSSSA